MVYANIFIWYDDAPACDQNYATSKSSLATSQYRKDHPTIVTHWEIISIYIWSLFI